MSELERYKTYDRGGTSSPSSFISLYTSLFFKLDISTICLHPHQGFAGGLPAACHGMLLIGYVADLRANSHQTEDKTPTTQGYQPRGLYRDPLGDENMFDGWDAPEQRTQGSPTTRPVFPTRPPSSVKLPERFSASADTRRNSRGPSKYFPPVASGSGTSKAPDTTQGQPPTNAGRFSPLLPPTVYGEIPMGLSPLLGGGSSVQSGVSGRVGDQSKTRSAQHSGQS